MPNSQLTYFVIAISSVSGGGKTTLVHKTAERLNASVLLFDDYRTVSQHPHTQQWLDGGCDIDEWQTPQFARDVAALKRGEPVTLPESGRIVQPTEFIVIEEPMGRARAEMAPHIDFVAVIDTPLLYRTDSAKIGIWNATGIDRCSFKKCSNRSKPS